MSDPILISTEYILVVDTDSFSDPFAKKLCAYCTGFLDETESGLEFSDLYYLEEGIEDDESPKGKVADEKNPFYGFINQHLDEEHIYSPCCTWLNKRYGYNTNGEYAILTEENYDNYNFPAPLSVGIFFDVPPNSDHISKIKERSLAFFDKFWFEITGKRVTIEGFRLIIHTKYAEEVLI